MDNFYTKKGSVYRKTKLQRERDAEKLAIKKLKAKIKKDKKNTKKKSKWNCQQGEADTVLGHGHLNRSRPNSYFKNYLDYCRSDYFITLKKLVLERDKYKCQKCNGKAQTAHHEKYRERWTDSKVKDCIAICHKCHENLHYNDIASKKLYYTEQTSL